MNSGSQIIGAEQSRPGVTRRQVSPGHQSAVPVHHRPFVRPEPPSLIPSVPTCVSEPHRAKTIQDSAARHRSHAPALGVLDSVSTVLYFGTVRRLESLHQLDGVTAPPIPPWVGSSSLDLCDSSTSTVSTSLKPGFLNTVPAKWRKCLVILRVELVFGPAQGTWLLHCRLNKPEISRFS